jgi:Tol biopolymer transport system component
MRRILLSLLGALIAAAPFAAPRLKTTAIFTSIGHTIRGDAAMTADGQRIYFIHEDSTLFVYSRSTGRETPVTSGKFGALIAVSPDGSRIVFARRGEDGDGPFLWALPVDKQSGTAAGPLKRLTLTKADAPSFSPDGKSIGFVAEEHSVAFVPASGGPERVLAKTGGYPGWIRWTPDSRTLYFGLSFNEDSMASMNGVYKLSIAGGTPQMVMHTPGWGQTPGLSPDGRTILTWHPSWDSLVIATAEGRRLATWKADTNEMPDVWFADGRGLAWTNVNPQAIYLRSLTGAADRAVTDTSWLAHFPAWSRDGNRIAARTVIPTGIAISNADGSGRKLIRTQFRPSNDIAFAWSPDGKSIVYLAQENQTTLSIVDVAGGSEKMVAKAAPVLVPPRWRSDSKAIMYASGDTALAPDSTREITVHEVTPAGVDHILRSVRLHCYRRSCQAKFANDTLLVGWGFGRDYALYNLRNRDEGRVIYTRPDGPQSFPVHSADGKWMAIRHPNPEGEVRMIDVMAVDGSGKKTVMLPFTTLGGERNPWISPDGRELIVTSAAQGGTRGIPLSGRPSLYRVTVSTGATEKLAEIPLSIFPGESAVSPDGRWIAHGVRGTSSVTFYEIDATALLKSVGNGGKK